MPNEIAAASGNIVRQLARGNVGLPLSIPTHTETGLAELIKFELTRRDGDGRLIHETERYVIGICCFDEVAALGDADFNQVLAEAQQGLPAEVSQQRVGEQRRAPFGGGAAAVIEWKRFF